VAETALTRTARALDLVPFVIENPGISVEELAQEFKVTPTQMLADLSMIFMCGLPGYSTLEMIDLSYDDGYVSIIDPQVLTQPRTLSKSELVSLTLSLESLASLRDVNDPLYLSIKNLQQKLQSTINLPLAEIPVVIRSEAKSVHLPLIERAIKSGSALEISYISASSDKHSTRTILPESIFSENGFIYLRAWCYLTQSSRTFRLDRIENASVVAIGDLERVAQPGKKASEEFVARLHIDKSARLFYEQNASLCTLESDDDSGLTVAIALRDSEWLIRSLMGYGTHIQVLGPDELRQSLSSRAESALALYKN
jgi:proteasome accessory factor C